MAALRIRSKDAYQTGIPLAHGRALDRPAQGLASIRKTGFLSRICEKERILKFFPGPSELEKEALSTGPQIFRKLLNKQPPAGGFLWITILSDGG